MDVAAAFPCVARGCLLRKMRAMGNDECSVTWTDSFTRDRRVIMSVDGWEREPMEVATGLPQGSPISPVVFAIYIVDIHAAVEGQVDISRGSSSVDDVTWLVEAQMSTMWSGSWSDAQRRQRAVRFETSKIEVVLFSRRRRHRRSD